MCFNLEWENSIFTHISLLKGTDVESWSPDANRMISYSVIAS